MKRVWVCTAIALTGCSTATGDIVATQSSPSGYDCDNLAAELRGMYARAGELAHLGGTPAEYARLRAEHQALRHAAVLKKCAKPLTPPLQSATPNAPEEESGTGPTIAPPQVPSASSTEVST